VEHIVKHDFKTRATSTQQGAALLIAIFALMLISVVALAMILLASTESAIGGNYKSALQSFYNAKAGLEEGRGRIFGGNTNPLTASGFPSGASTLAIGQVWYILNPASGETVNPANLVASNAYADFEYNAEWGVPVTGATVHTVTSTSSVAGLPPANYKWVRITPRTEKSAGLDINGDGVINNSNVVMYDGSQQLLANQPSGNQTYQVYTVTALAVTPSGGRRMLQYNVSPAGLNLTFPSALTFDGPGATYGGPNSNPFTASGSDLSGSGGEPASCNNVPVTPPKYALGTTSNTDAGNVSSGIPGNRTGNYTGAGSSTPSVGNIASGLPPSEQTPAGLDGLVQQITSVANNVITGPASTVPLGSAAAPQITVVNGDLSISGNSTGYGILVVTGNLSFSGTVGWRGIVLVVGKGTFTYSGGGNNEFDGAIFVAKTKDAVGNELSVLGAPSVNWGGGGGDGIHYDHCWINSALSGGGLPVKVLSFREIQNF
jgi:Tfp pilus assembly protein PilX